MAKTKTGNLINVTAFADALSTKLGDAIRLEPLAHIEDLTGTPAGKISVPKFAYIGDASDMIEGEALDPTLLVADTDDIDVKQAGKAVEITDKAVASSFGDPLNEAEAQILKAIANKVDKDMFNALATAKLEHEGDKMNTNTYNKALEKFGEEQDEEHYILVNPNQSANIKGDQDYKEGAWEGELLISNRVPENEAYIVKPGAIGLYLSKEVDVEQDRDILAKSTVISADEIYAVHLRDDSKAIKITFA